MSDGQKLRGVGTYWSVHYQQVEKHVIFFRESSNPVAEADEKKWRIVHALEEGLPLLQAVEISKDGLLGGRNVGRVQSLRVRLAEEWAVGELQWADCLAED